VGGFCEAVGELYAYLNENKLIIQKFENYNNYEVRFPLAAVGDRDGTLFVNR